MSSAIIKFRCKLYNDSIGKQINFEDKRFLLSETWTRVLKHHKIPLEFHDARKYEIETLRHKHKAKLSDTVHSVMSLIKGRRREVAVCLVEVVRPASRPSRPRIIKRERTPDETVESNLSTATQPIPSITLRAPVHLFSPVRETSPDTNYETEDDEVSQLGTPQLDSTAEDIKDKAIGNMQRIPPKDFLQCAREWSKVEILLERKFISRMPTIKFVIGKMFVQKDNSLG